MDVLAVYQPEANQGWGKLVGLAIAAGLAYLAIAAHKEWRRRTGRDKVVETPDAAVAGEDRPGWLRTLFDKSPLAPYLPQDVSEEPPPAPSGGGEQQGTGGFIASAMFVPTIQEVLKANRVNVDVTGVTTGPTATRFAIEVPPSVRVQTITKLLPDLQVALRTERVRLQVPIPGKNAIGIEVPNPQRSWVEWKRVLPALTTELAIPLGADMDWTIHAPDLAKMPHLLVGGATGGGKSAFLKASITAFTRNSPSAVQLMLIDPKRVEFGRYRTLPNLWAPVVFGSEHAAEAFEQLVAEMDDRYARMAEVGASNIDEYNARTSDPNRKMFRLVAICDELADVMLVDKAGVETNVVRLGQLARAAGIHLVLATQRPSVDVITGLIKANFPARLAFLVSSQADSRVILDQNGAETLAGSGDALFLGAGTSTLIRVQVPWVADEEASDTEHAALATLIQAHIKPAPATASQGFHTTGVRAMDVQAPTPADPPRRAKRDPDLELLLKVAHHVVTTGSGSTSSVQRALGIGYNKAAKMMERLEAMDVVGEVPSEGNLPRDVHYEEEHLDAVLAMVERKARSGM